VLYLYDELGFARRAPVAQHVLACGSCRGEIEKFRETLALIDRARLAETATVSAPGDWESLRSALTASRRQVGVWRTPLLRAAAVLLLAGATFVLGRYWDRVSTGDQTARGYLEGVTPDVSAVLLDPRERLTRFVSENEGYLRKSHIVLLEFANGDAAQDAGSLSQVSRALLKDSRRAEQIAGQLADPRIQGLVARLNAALGTVAALEDSDAGARDQARRVLNDSGVLEELEILNTMAGATTTERTRT